MANAQEFERNIFDREKPSLILLGDWQNLNQNQSWISLHLCNVGEIAVHFWRRDFDMGRTFSNYAPIFK